MIMKLITKRSVVASAMLLFLGISGCSKGEYSGSEETSESQTGKVAFSSIAQNILQETTKSDEKTFEIPDSLIPASDDFTLHITGSYYDYEDKTVKEFDQSYESIAAYSVSSLIGGLPDLPSSYNSAENTYYDYTAKVTYGDKDGEGEGKPYFEGSTTFRVVARGKVEVSIPATLANSIFSFATTSYFDNYYNEGGEFTISTSNDGAYSFENGVSSKLIFAPVGTALYISGSGTRNGKTHTFNLTKVATTKSCTHSLVNVDSDTYGEPSFGVVLNDDTADGGSEDFDMNPTSKE